jgi:hypothetical protein
MAKKKAKTPILVSELTKTSTAKVETGHKRKVRAPAARPNAVDAYQFVTGKKSKRQAKSKYRLNVLQTVKCVARMAKDAVENVRSEGVFRSTFSLIAILRQVSLRDLKAW